MITDLALLRLLQLVSPGLPIGMYSYSQGLECAVDEAWVSSATDAGEWIEGVLENCVVRVDLPVLARIYDAWVQNDRTAAENWSATLLALRETSELRTEDRQTGQALASLLSAMDMDEARYWQRNANTTLALMFAFAAVRWSIPRPAALEGFLWSWLENQVLAAVKLVPLGQVAGQRLLHELAAKIPGLVAQGLQLNDDEIGGSVFALALSSSRHEMQYSRLFRS
ncbi:MAG: urease accessory protein UreF [Gammaproteobacteria bacterium HGW-Gammaproteobacteria-3]|nr:MAG: urease accessory protein UreF [Gammaproteobacteria bacterium HGW-Gammaproteobacteria-3]